MSEENKGPLAPQFSTAPGERSALANPKFNWIPTGDCHDFQLADNPDFERPLVDLQKTYDLSYTLEPGFAIDGSADKTYHYRVRGHDLNGPGAWNSGSFVFRSKLPPKPEFTVVPPQSTPDPQPRFEWAASDEVQAFELQVARDPGFEDLVASERVEGVRRYDLLGALDDLGRSDGVYYYRVRSLLADDDLSEWCFDAKENRFELVTRPLPPVFVMRPDLRTNNPRPRFSWETSSALGARRFRFEISNTFDFSGQVIPYETRVVNEDTYVMEGKLPPGMYYYRICSVDHMGKPSVWNQDPVANRFLLDPRKPNEPIVEVEEFITRVPMPISGTKDPKTSVLMNGETIVDDDDEMAWSTSVEIFYGVNVLVFHTATADGVLSNPVVKICTFNPAMRNYDFYTRDSLSDQGEEPGEADYGSAPDTVILGPPEKMKLDPDGGVDRANFDSDVDFEVFEHFVKGTLRQYLADPGRLAGTHRLDPTGENRIFVRVQNKGFSSGVCNFRLFWAPYTTWPKVSQWVEMTREFEDADGKPTRWHPFPEEVPGSNADMVVSDPIIWGPEDPGFPRNGEHGCIITVIQADAIIEDPAFLLDRPLEGSYLQQMLDSYPEVFRLATYMSNNVTFKNINVVRDISVEPREGGRRGRTPLVPADDAPGEHKVAFKDPQPGFWRERVLINGPAVKTHDASLVLDVSDFDENGSVWLKLPKDLLPASRRLKVTGGAPLRHDAEMFPELRRLLFDDPGKFLVYKVNNEFEMEMEGLDLGINQRTHAELVYSLSSTACENVQYTISLIQLFAKKEVGRVLSIIQTQRPERYPYFGEVEKGLLHTPESKCLKKIGGEDLRPFADRRSALLSGYTACDRCLK